MNETEKELIEAIKKRAHQYSLGYDVDYDNVVDFVIEEVRTAVDEREKEIWDKEVIRRDRIIEHMNKEIKYLRASQPARNKPVLKIKVGENNYIPMITECIDSPEGLFIQAELQALKGGKEGK